MKKLYRYDPASGVFVNIQLCRNDAITGKPLAYRNTTDVEVIPEKAGYQRYFKKTEKAWDYVVDNVGTEYWDADGTKHTIAELGVEVPEGALLEEPVIPPTEEELAATARATRDTLVDRVSREIERRIDVGEDVTEWRTYRQFLRDIPEQAGFPNSVDWGTQPADFTGK